jgi:AcrR family transcriptional regulator
MTDVVVTRRERARAATIAEIKEAAFGLMAESGTIDVRFTDIARVMGMTPPALYRYYADRDDLLGDLISDCYEHLGAAVAAGRDSVPADDIGGRWYAAATAYREWARTQPQRFALVFGLPVPGYVAPEDGPTTEAAKRAMSQLGDLFISAAQSGQLRPPLVTEVSGAIAACADEKHPELEGIVPPESFQAMLQAWASLHGFTCLEAYGHFDWVGEEAREELFRGHVTMIARAAGVPAPN